MENRNAILSFLNLSLNLLLNLKITYHGICLRTIVYDIYSFTPSKIPFFLGINE